MNFYVTVARRDGVPIPGWQHHMREKWVGRLVVLDEIRADLHRTSRVAKLIDPVMRHGVAMPPPGNLYDATLVAIRDEDLILTGFERVFLGCSWTDVAQSWLLRPAPDDDRTAPYRPWVGSDRAGVERFGRREFE